MVVHRMNLFQRRTRSEVIFASLHRTKADENKRLIVIGPNLCRKLSTQ